MPIQQRKPHESTLVEDAASGHAGASAAESSSVPALVLIWSEDEPERVGEALILPLAPGMPFSIGRALEPGEDGALPLGFRRLRPFSVEDTGPLGAPRVSRHQLRVQLGADGTLQVEQTGRGLLHVHQRPVERATLRPGDVLEAVGRFTLLYTRRPREWPREQPFGTAFPFGAADEFGLVGESPAMWQLRSQIAFLARRGDHVLVHGPSGSGKELVVRAIHAASSRGERTLVARNAATIPEALIDAELFGNLKNYPNPGMADRVGLLGEADGSTLFLDEVGELSHTLQAHLLRVMDGGDYMRLGETSRRSSGARLIGATNRDPAGLKHDLLARFPHRLRVPGFEERPEDVLLIARHYLRRFAAEDPSLARFFIGDQPRLAAQLAHELVRHPFTSHSRELAEILWRAIAASPGAVLEPPPGLVQALGSDKPERHEKHEKHDKHEKDDGHDVHEAMGPKDLTRAQIVEALERCGGVREQAWRELGLRSRDQLKRLLKKYDIV